MEPYIQGRNFGILLEAGLNPTFLGYEDYLKSDTPRKAGGLMSGAASKAVDPFAKRRAKARLSCLI